MVRITGGSHRGQCIQVPAHEGVRPTTGRVREAVFNMLQTRLAGGWMLDLFAGSGLMGMEALSRGAGFAVFVDHHPTVCQAIQQNIDRMQWTNSALVIRGSVPRGTTLARIESLFHQWSAQHGDRSAIIFMDPPYGRNLVGQTLSALGQCRFIVPGTLVVAEHEDGTIFDDLSSWEPLQYRRYGDTRISIFAKIAGKENSE